MHRSGINAIGKWLLRQSSLKRNELRVVYGDWIEKGDVRHGLDLDTYTFISQINHPDHVLYENYYSENNVMTIERESAEQVEKFCQDNSLYNWRPIHEYMDIDYDDARPTWNHVFIIRSFKNWLASVVKAHETACAKDPDNPILTCYNVHQDIEKYRSYLNWASTMAFSGREGFDPHIVVYDKWVQDKQYRKKLVKSLGLPKFTDAGFKDVPQNCGGSSFDGLEFNGKADEMKVLERWKEYENDEGFMNTLDHYSDIVRMSDRICGE